jgi:hypothetical protein
MLYRTAPSSLQKRPSSGILTTSRMVFPMQSRMYHLQMSVERISPPFFSIRPVTKAVGAAWYVGTDDTNQVSDYTLSISALTDSPDASRLSSKPSPLNGRRSHLTGNSMHIIIIIITLTIRQVWGSWTFQEFYVVFLFYI